jgi:Terpene cyclase DEP1
VIHTAFRALLILLAGGFAVAFAAICIPPFIENPDILGAFAGGFVNPYATGYSLDVFFTYGVLAAWVLYEANTKGIRHGWIALVIGVAPGVATGFAVYLLLRMKQERAAS